MLPRRGVGRLRVRGEAVIADDVPLEELIGALVSYTGGMVPEYGLVQSGNPSGSSLFVRFGHSDMAQAVLRRQLTLVVPAVRNSDRELLADLRHRLVEAKKQASILRQALDARRAQMESEADTPMGELLDTVYAVQDEAERLVEIVTRP
jgi:hypothetical protein